MMVWGRAADIKREVAHVPDNWLIRFAVTHPDDIRKLGEARCSSLLFRVEAVLRAIDTGECRRKYNYCADPTVGDIRPGVTAGTPEGGAL